MSTATEQITVIPYDEATHFPILKEWFEARKGIEVRPDFFRHGGVALNEDGEPIAAYFIYFSLGVPVAHTQWAIARPNNSVAETSNALAKIVEFFEETCREGDYIVMLTHCTKRLSSHVSRIGFTVEEEDTSSCFKLVGAN